MKKTKVTRAAIPQFNVRSAFAVKRAADLARKAGTTTTKVVEDASRAYDVDDVVKDRQNWHDELRDIVRRAKEGQSSFDWRAIENDMYDDWGNANDRGLTRQR